VANLQPRGTPVGVTIFAYYYPNSPRLLPVPCTHFRKTTAYRLDVTTEILIHWVPDTVPLPAVNELGRFLDTPLHERAKIPMGHDRFDGLISSPWELDDRIARQDLEALFRVDDEERAEGLYALFCMALMDSPPPLDGTENAFISF